ncbi:MAG: TolC family protein [Flavobacteriaceae bacterium]|nr:TolC family protein [Flavobacteriaceae bacterium]
MRKISIFILLFSAYINAQNFTMSLEEAIDFGLKNSYSVLNADRDIDIAKKTKWQTISTGLPQLNAKIDYQNWIKQQVSLVPAQFFGGKQGEFMELKFGTKQSVNASATLSQLIFDGSYLVGVQSTKTYLKISELAKVKTEKAVREAIINAYGNALLVEESLKVLEKNKTSLKKNIKEIEQLYKNGFTEEESVEQLKLTLASVKSSLSKAQKMKKIAYKMLNIVLGIDIDKNVTLSDDLNLLATKNLNLDLLQKETKIENHIDYLIAKNAERADELKVKYEKSKALPSLSAFVNYRQSSNSEEFTFFDKEQKWIGSSLIGVSLNIPIFTSFGRTAKIQQAKITLEKSITKRKETEQKLLLQIEKAKADYAYAVEEYNTSKENLKLAERIEKKQQIKFFEGISSSFNLMEAQRQLYQMQQNYLRAMLDLISKKAGLDTAVSH